MKHEPYQVSTAYAERLAKRLLPLSLMVAGDDGGVVTIKMEMGPKIAHDLAAVLRSGIHVTNERKARVEIQDRERVPPDLKDIEQTHPKDIQDKADFVRHARSQLGLSRDGLADLLKMADRTTVARWERGDRIPPDLVLQTLIWILEPGRPKCWPSSPLASAASSSAPAPRST